MVDQHTEKYELARNSLPEDLIPVFDDLVADYRFAATRNHGSPFVSYIALADLVRVGWRLTEEPDAARKQERALQEMFRELPSSPNFDEFFYSMDSWESIASSYRRAGDLLCDVLLNTSPRDTSLAFPILFCYRHFLEVSLKGLIHFNTEIPTSAPTKAPIGHFLNKLWDLLNDSLSENTKSTTMWQDATVEDGKVIAGVQTGNVQDDLQLLYHWCAQFSKEDPTSDRFRYPESPKGDHYKFPCLNDLFGFEDLDKLKSEMARLGDAIHNIGLAIAGEIEHG